MKKYWPGYGFGIEEARPSIELAHLIRHSHEVGVPSNAHPFSRVHAEPGARTPAHLYA